MLLVIGVCIPLATARAGPHPGQSLDVVIIGGAALDLASPCTGFGAEANNMGATLGGCLPVTGPVGELGDFVFSAMTPAAVSAASLAPFDTAVLNVASIAMACSTAMLAPAQQADLVAFVGAGNKLIIFDSECDPQDYSWLPFPFTTANPGARGAPGTLTVVEDNLLSTLIGDPSCVGGDPHCIDVAFLGLSTDAVGDMNVMVTLDPNWCVDMAGTNAIPVTGPVHTYANFPSGTDDGLMIYNGLDQDFQGFGTGEPNLRKIWVQELQQPFDPSGLPCRVSVVGITLSPDSDTNEFGDEHTVTANLTDLLGVPETGILVDFEVVGGPNVGQVSDPGECSVNADCTTDAAGDVSWTYTDTAGLEDCDAILAIFVNADGDVIESARVEKCWEPPPNTPPGADCTESVNPSGKKIPPAGSTTLPGPKGGQNEDGFYELSSVDAEDGTAPLFVTNASGSVTFGPFASGSVVKITEDPDATPSSQPMGGPNSAVSAHIKLDSDAFVFAVDSFGETSPVVSCLVPPPPK